MGFFRKFGRELRKIGKEARRNEGDKRPYRPPFFVKYPSDQVSVSAQDADTIEAKEYLQELTDNEARNSLKITSR